MPQCPKKEALGSLTVSALPCQNINNISIAAMARFGRGLGQGQALSNVGAKTALLGYEAYGVGRADN